MPFLDTIITAAKNIEGLQAKIDKALHPQYYYKKERDVPIIEQVRAIFSASFKGRPLPVELQYKHEYDRPTDTSSAPTEPSEYQPPFFLAKKLSVGVQFAIGNNSISDQCRSVIITIQTYIDALNECAGKATNKFPNVHYGHESDSIRFVFLLIINAFTALSKLNLDEKSTLDEASLYINFLSRLIEDTRLFQELSKISVADKSTPLSIMAYSCKRLKQIQQHIVFHSARCGILEHTISLDTEMNQLVRNGFIFYTYIMSESAVTTKQTDYLEDSCVKRPSETPHLIVLRDTLAILMRPTNTSSARRQIANEQSTIEPFSYNPVSQQWVGIQDRPFPAKNSGVFAPFQQSGQGRLLQEYIKFGESLKTLVQLRAGLADFQILVRTGGDFIAVAYFSEHTRCMLGLIEQCLTNLTGSYSALYTFAEEQYNSLCGVHKRTDQENIWMGNYQHLKALLANSPLEEIGTNLLDQIEKIHAILKSWKKNPQQNIERFQAARQNFTALLIKLNTSMSISNPTDSDKYLSWTTVLTAEPVADVSVDLILAEPDFVDDSATLSDLMLVKEILTNYAIAHKYQFNLSNIDPDIQIEGASSEKWKLALFQYKADHHKQRAEWIYDCLVTINSTDEALIKWSVLEQSIHVIESDVSQSVHFKSKNEKEGIGAQIEKIKALIQKNTAALPIPTSVQPSDIPTASKVKKPSPPTASATAPKSSLNPTVVTVPDTSAPPLTQDNPTVQNATIPAAPVNPNLVIIGQLTAWIDSAYNNPNKVEQEAFLNQFWKPLCYLEGKRFFTQTRNSALLMQYSVAQTQQTLVTQRQQFLLEVQKHSDPNTPLGAWAEEVSETLQKANASTPEAAKKQAQQKIAADAAITKQASATQQKLNLKKEDASSDLASLAWDEKTHTQLQQFMLHHKKNPLNINQVTSFLKYISECLLRKNAPKKEEVEALDKILSDILDTHSKSVAAKNDKALYLSCIVQGLISLGANPIHWMEKQMPEPTVSTTLDMTGFYIMTEQSSLIISSLILRTEHLDESSAFLQEKLSNFLRAIQTFGERLFRCVDTDDAWWYLLAKKMGIEAKGDARRQRAALFLGALKETYTILNDQLQDAIGGQTSSWKTAISYFETTAENYKKAVTASWFTNDGFKAWEALVLARDAVKKEIASIGRLRKNRELALINVQETAAKEAAQKEADLANQKTAEAEQKTTVALQEAAAATNAKTVAEADAKKAEKKSVSIVLSHLGGQISAKIATHFNVAAIQTIQGSSNKGLAFSSRLEVLIAAIETQFEIKDIDLMIKNDILSKMFADPAYTSLRALIKPAAPNISGVKATMYGGSPPAATSTPLVTTPTPPPGGYK